MLKKFVMLMAVALVGCGPVDGTPCEEENTFECVEKTRFMKCERGEYREYPCPGGCFKYGARVFCKYDGVREGTACPMEFNDTVAACENSRSLVTCRAGRFTAQACPTSCTMGGQNADGFEIATCQ